MQHRGQGVCFSVEVIDCRRQYRKFVRPAGGVLFYQLLVPRSMRAELLVLMYAGSACHLDVRKTIDQVQRRANWFSWRSDTDRFCRRCGPCNQYAKGRVPRQGLLQEMRVGAPMDRVELDLTGPHVSINGLTYICTVMCSFTKFVVAWPIRDKKATTVTRWLMKLVILPLCSFWELLTDDGKEFENELCHELCQLMGIEKLRTTFYMPQCNGGIERWHSAMNSLLAKAVEVHQKDSPQRLACVVAAYNATVHESTGYSPNFLIFGRELAVPVDMALRNPPAD